MGELTRWAIAVIMVGSSSWAGCGDSTTQSGSPRVTPDTAITDTATADSTIADAAISDTSGGTDAAISDTSGEADTAISDTSGGADTAISDAAISDTAINDTAINDTAPADTTPPPDPTWTVLVYMVADNNLEEFAIEDLTEMMAAGSTGSVNIIVQSDRAADYSMAAVGGLSDWTTAKRLRVEAGSLTELADLGELNMGDPTNLADFIGWGLTTYPADRTALVFWDHGGAWPGFGGDESTADTDLLTLAELDWGLSEGLARTDTTDRLDVIGFDACLMATVEVAATMKPYGRTLLASEELEPGHGWDWSALATLSDDPSTTPAELAEAILTGFQMHAEGDETVTLSAVNLDALGPVTAGVDALATALLAQLPGAAPELGAVRAAAFTYGSTSQGDPGVGMVDVADLADSIALSVPAASTAASALATAIDAAVLYRTAGALTAHSRGLSIYFPERASDYDPAYDAVGGTETWRQLLGAYFDAGAALGADGYPTFSDPDHLAEVVTAADGSVSLSGELTADTAGNVAEVLLYFGELSDTGAMAFFGETPGGIQGTTASAWWDEAAALTLTQGSTAAFAYARIEPGGDGLWAFDAELDYVPPEGGEALPVTAQIVVDADWEVQTITYYALNEGGQYGELVPEAGGQLYGVYWLIDGDATSWPRSNEAPLDPTAPITVAWDTLTLAEGWDGYGELWALDFAGNGDYVYHVGQGAAAASCVGTCGASSPDESCWCDETCAANGDCCADICDACPTLSICGQ